MSILVSIFAYTIGKTYNDVDAFVKHEIDAGERAEWPCFRTLGRLHRLEPDLWLSVDSSTLIAKARSRAAGLFERSEADAWLSVDDDVEASEADLSLLLSAAHSATDIVVAPCVLRGKDALNVAATKRVLRKTSSGVRLLECDAAGLALSSVSRRAIATLGSAYPELRWHDAEGKDTGLGVFLEAILEHRWHGEDYAFCRRARAAGLRIEALCDSEVVHAGRAARINKQWLEGAEATTLPDVLNVKP